MNLPTVTAEARTDAGWHSAASCTRSDGKTHLVVIQPSSFCNINCRYCYVPGRSNRSVMEPSVLEDILAKVFSSDRVADGFRLVWHNGEPLALGIDFYRQAIKTIEKVNTKSKPFYHCIQTNGTLINDQWAEFFIQHQIAPTVSIDGPQHIHDANRVTRSGSGSFAATMRGVEILRNHGIRLVGLCVVTSTSLDHGAEIFRFFHDEKFTSMGLIIEEPWGGNPSTSFTDLAVRKSVTHIEDRFRRFIGDFYDAWYPFRNELEVREFNDLFTAFRKLKNDSNSFSQQEDASPCTVISFNQQGGVTTFSPQMIAGTTDKPDRFIVSLINNLSSLDDLDLAPAHIQLREQINQGIRRCQSECGYFQLCGGGAPASKFYEHGTFDCTVTRECRFSKQLLSEVLLDKLTRSVKD